MTIYDEYDSKVKRLMEHATTHTEAARWGVQCPSCGEDTAVGRPVSVAELAAIRFVNAPRPAALADIKFDLTVIRAELAKLVDDSREGYQAERALHSVDHALFELEPLEETEP